MRKVFSFVAGALMGSLVGATLAVLLAPMSGPELQEQVRTRFQRVREEVTTAAAARRAELERRLAALRAPRTPEA